ncbi:zinc finger protein 568-like isoform X2 [Neoarius graeffei]|uniref:zinc finger protein 568-like isoform X2 n=1 Tax=Neoarius graeffei TaxID=443677 RepID=UPI00298CFB67|nr:zinc finger protein 568-like isoform X2 [Neoarius graeffei]
MAGKQPKRIRSEEQKLKKKGYDQARARSRVNIGEAFQRWRDFREDKDMKTDAEVAVFLLDTFSNVTRLPAATRADWTSTDEASGSDDRKLKQEDAASAPVEIELVLTKSMTNKPVAGSQDVVSWNRRDVQRKPFTAGTPINLSGTRYVSLTKETFERLMFCCLECSSECRIRGKGRGQNLTFRQECLICCNYRVWTSQAADLPNNKVTECSPCDDARGPSSDDILVTVDQEHTSDESPKLTCEDNAQAAADSISVREKHDENVKEEELSLLMETHEDSAEEEGTNLALISDETTNPNYPESSDTLTADEELFIDECSDELSENESDHSSQNTQDDTDDEYLPNSSEEELFTDEDSSKELTKKMSSKSSKKRLQEHSDEYMPSSLDEALESCDEGIFDKGFTKKPFQNTIKPVIWCMDCEAVAKMFCTIQRHKKNYCCAECVSGDAVENLSLKDYSVHFSDIQSFHLHAIAEHCGTEKIYEHKICQDCNKTIRVETDPNKKGHVCEYKVKPFSCNVCHKRFITEIGQKVHYRRLHRDYQHTCRYCMMVFDTKQSKLEHEQSHKEDMLCYLCPDCPEKFKDFVTRNEHLKTHPGQKRHICSICNRKFAKLHTFERHLRIHSGEKPFKCEVCNRSFNQDGHLKSHMRLHTGEKPFLCEHCGESFNHNISLRNHRQRHHGITDSSCVLAEENKPIGRPIRNKDQPRRHRRMRCSADVELESYESDSDEEQQKRGQKRKSRRKKQDKNNVQADS